MTTFFLHILYIFILIGIGLFFYKRYSYIKAQNKSLQEETARYKTLLNISKQVIYKMQIDTREYTYISDNCEDVLGISKSEFTNHPNLLRERLHHDSLQFMTKFYERITEGCGDLFIEYKIYDSQKKVRIIRQYNNFIKNEHNNAIAVECLIVDVTDEIKTKERQNFSEKLFGKLTKNMPSVVIFRTSNNKISYVNNAFSDIFGRPEREFVHDPNVILTWINPSDIQLYNSIRSHNYDEIKVKEIRFRVIHPDGSQRWLWSISSMVRDQNPNNEGILTIINDITELKQREKKLEYANKSFTEIFETIPDAMLLIEPNEGNITMINKHAVEMFKFPTNDLSQYRLERISNGQFKFFNNNDLKQILHGETKIYEWEYKLNDNTTIYLEVVLKKASIHNEKRILAVIRDVTSRTEMKQILANATIEGEQRERKKLADELHDGLGPMLSVAQMYVSFIAKMIPTAKNDVLKNLKDIIEQATIKIKTISKILTPHLLLNYGLYSALEQMGKQLEKSEQFQFIINSNFTTLRFPEKFELMLYRIITELINNTLRHSNGSEIRIRMNFANNVLTVYYSDNGKGLNYEEIFVRNENRGLGLYNIKHRVEVFKGEISFDTAPGKGFATKLSLPTHTIIKEQKIDII